MSVHARSNMSTLTMVTTNCMQYQGYPCDQAHTSCMCGTMDNEGTAHHAVIINVVCVYSFVGWRRSKPIAPSSALGTGTIVGIMGEAHKTPTTGP
jgi:hypothetical protein